MKKILLLIAFMLLTLTGCGEKNIDDAINDFSKDVENSKSYKLNGTMEISSGEEIFTYNIDTYFLKDDYYKVILVNQTNNHEQIILKNPDGLYVVTPSLNKSFKFDSVWPENSSQAYLLQNLVNDVKNDSEATLEKTEDGYIIKSTVNYPNNEELTYQKIYFDNDMNIKKVEVYNAEDIVKIKVTFKSVDLKAKLDEDDFLLDDLIDTETNTENNTQTNENNANTECTGENCENQNTCEGENCEEQTNATLDSIIYPLYIPSNTHLSSSETIDTETGERVILTFSGDKNFVIVEEVAKVSNEFEVIPVFGDPLMLNESVGALSSNSISWHSDNISYYLVSSDLSTNELISVAKSLGNASTVISTK
ncbi:MAG TPA: outer membrane lipoprotein carrier protein LolA [Candidatus Onthocola stercorigallinarum]|nr:outer membrane lipoprotein carrier protein LolA [Candidatus Onthocola stercorigallinarum]